MDQINQVKGVFWTLTSPLKSPDATPPARIGYHLTVYSWVSLFACVFHPN